jgi:hypothetical protein
MNSLGPWTTGDFEEMSWHDVHVHGLRLDNFIENEGSANLILDIDYILKWEQHQGEFLFTVCRAELAFRSVFGLKVSLDYTTPTAGMCPFAISGIERERIESPTGYKSFRWRLPVNWPSGLIEFEATDFEQSLIGSPVAQPSQHLAPEQRGRQIAG